jgi:hypothetical protein
VSRRVLVRLSTAALWLFQISSHTSLRHKREGEKKGM